MVVTYENDIKCSDFEVEMIKHFRNILEHGYGRIEVAIHAGRLTKFEPHKHYEQEKLKQFAEAQ